MSLGPSPIPRRAPVLVKPPEVVAQDEVTGATAATAARTIFVPRETGMYGIQTVGFTTTGGDAGVTIQPNVIHTDRVGAVTEAVGGTLSLAATGRTPGYLGFEANAGTAIQWSTTLAGVRAASVHDIRVILTRLR